VCYAGLVERCFYVYCWTNTVNGKKYVGKGKNRRAWHHMSRAKSSTATPVFYRAIRKYGKEAFHLEMLYTGLSEAEAYVMEIESIRVLGTRDPDGYNLTDGGEGVSGIDFSDETKARMSSSANRRWEDQSQRDLVSEQSRDRMRNPAARQNLSDKATEQWASAEARNQMSVLKKAAMTDELKTVLSEKAKLQWERDRAKLMTIHASPEVKKARAEAQRKCTDAQIGNIRMLLVLGARGQDVASWFQLRSAGTVSNIRLGRGIAYAFQGIR
jgi:group I intron endonuclease